MFKLHETFIERYHQIEERLFLQLLARMQCSPHPPRVIRRSIERIYKILMS